MSTTELLEAARTRVAKGWTKWVYEDEDGSFCTMGALMAAQEELKLYHGEYQQAIQRLSSHLPDLGLRAMSLVTFNDQEATHDMVLGLFDKAIADESI
jgi:hypothetical protein